MVSIRKVEKLRCVSCNQEFVPRTFHEEVLLYPIPRRSDIVDYKHHFKDDKPKEVINQMWITYCTNCGYVLRFKKTLAQLKKTIHSPADNRYEEVEFHKPISEYTDYLNDLLDLIESKIINFSVVTTIKVSIIILTVIYIMLPFIQLSGKKNESFFSSLVHYLFYMLHNSHYF